MLPTTVRVSNATYHCTGERQGWLPSSSPPRRAGPSPDGGSPPSCAVLLPAGGASDADVGGRLSTSSGPQTPPVEDVIVINNRSSLI